MTVLSDSDVLNMVRSGALKIDPFSEECLTPNGYDLKVGEVKTVNGVKLMNEGGVKIDSFSWFLVLSEEKISMDRETCASIWMKSSWSRRGVIGSFGKVDAGFEGKLVLPMFNASHEAFTITLGQRIVQVVFERLLTAANKSYPERSGRYQQQSSL